MRAKEMLYLIETIQSVPISKTLQKQTWTFSTDYKKHRFYVDKSVETFGDVITHIPYDHLYCEEHYEKKHIGYDIQYVKCRYFDQTVYYFELSTLSDLQLDTIISFLSNE